MKPKNHLDLGFTDEEFLELVDFFQELMRLDQKGKRLDEERVRLVAVCRSRTRQLAEEKKVALKNEMQLLDQLL